MTLTDPRAAASTELVAVCPLDALTPERGVAALVAGTQVAIFRVEVDGADRVYAIDHRDPIGGANVLARGLTGQTHGRWYVASPLLKQRFDLESGACLDAPTVTVRSWPTSIVDGWVHVTVDVAI